jgi:hypothetical protein
MSRVIDFCEDSDDNGEWPNTASVPSLPLSRKRTLDKEEASNDAHHRDENGPGNNANELEVSPHKKRRGVVKSERSAKKDAAVKCAQIMKGVEATEKDVDSEDAQGADHREHQEGIAAAASHPTNSDEPPSSASGRQRRVSAREERLSELADYRKIHGHCNVPQNYCENSKLSKWVKTQRSNYTLYQEGKTSSMTTFRIQELEKIGFEWGVCVTAWEDRLSELADYRKIHGHCNVPKNYSENTKLANWVTTQRSQYRLHLLKGKISRMTHSRIEELESLGFEWGCSGTVWEDRLSELAGYRKIHGHCNVPQNYSENTKLANWVTTQRSNYTLHQEGKTSSMTTFRIQALEKISFEWGCSGVAWEYRLSELADYRKIHGHCNVPQNYSENTKLGNWVTNQRSQYRLHLKGKISHMTHSRIQELESLGFEWDCSGTVWEDRLSELAGYLKIYGHCNVPYSYSHNSKLGNWVKKQRNLYRLQQEGKTSSMTISRTQALESLGFKWDCSSNAWEVRLSELADYRKIYGHCNVPYNYSENSKLGHWVGTQRTNYRFHVEGKRSQLNTLRIHELESLGFEWVGKQSTKSNDSKWEDRLSELADYRKIQGHCNVPESYSENTKLGHWVTTQRSQYRFHVEGKRSQLTTLRIHELESLGFEWVGKQSTKSNDSKWEDRLSELADYRKIQGHCNVPESYSENTKLANWVEKQRCNYRLHVNGKTSPMTPFRIQELKSLGFEWDYSGPSGATWEDRLSELADYCKLQGHCNVPENYNENTKLANWVFSQRRHYKLHLEGKKSPMTLSRIQKLECLGFKWDHSMTLSRIQALEKMDFEWDYSGPSCATWEGRLSELADYRKIQGHCNVPESYSENTELANWVGTQRINYRLHLQGNTSSMTHSRIQELESLGFQWDCSGVTWEVRLRELADYRKIHGHCNVPESYSENTKLGKWVKTQRSNYTLHQEGKTSSMTTFRIQELEKISFEWDCSGVTTWEDRLSELADYRKIHGHCNVPQNYSENTKLANWVTTQRSQYRLHFKGKSHMTHSRIEELESLGFEWDCYGAAWKDRLSATWKDRLSELAGYRKIHGHCNVPKNYSENTKLANWVTSQRSQYRLHFKGKSHMAHSRIQELESLGFEWDCYGAAWKDRLSAAWKDRLSELAGYRKIHGHCNVPKNYSENTKLANWVTTQRSNYWLHLQGNISQMTTFRILELESLGFEWDCYNAAWEYRLSELADYRKIQGHCNVPRYYSKNTKLGSWVFSQRSQYKLHLEGKKSPMTLTRIQELECLGFKWVCVTTWEDRLSELAGYRKIHGDCNVPHNYSENIKLAYWVANQRKQYKSHLEGKRSQLTTLRIQELESLDFEWNPSISHRRGTSKKSNLEDDVTSARERTVPVGLTQQFEPLTEFFKENHMDILTQQDV